MLYLYGQDVLRVGLQSYFKKYAFQNTELADFLKELGDAAKKMGVAEALVEWSNTWLKTAGINIIEIEVEEEGDVIKNLQVV